MDKEECILLVIIGIAVVAVSFISKNFYASKGTVTLSDQRVPTWQGRLVFWVVGGMMILGGLLFLFPNQ